MDSMSTWKVVLRDVTAAGLLLVVTATASAQDAAAASREELLAAARGIMATAPLCALITTSESGYPNVRMMDPFEPDEEMVIWLATNSSSRKAREIRKEPRVALYYSDPEGAGYVTIKGSARLVDDPEETRSRWKERWAEFYEADRSNYLLIEVRPTLLEVVSYRHGIVSESVTWSAPVVTFDSAEESPQD